MEKKTLRDYTKEELDTMSVRQYNELLRSVVTESKSIEVTLLSEEDFVKKSIEEDIDDTDLAINPPSQEELRNWWYERCGK